MSFLSGWKSYITAGVQIVVGVGICVVAPTAAPIGITMALAGLQAAFTRNAIAKLEAK